MKAAGQHTEVERVGRGYCDDHVVRDGGDRQELEYPMLGRLYGGNVAFAPAQGLTDLGARFAKEPPVTGIGLGVARLAFGSLTIALRPDFAVEMLPDSRVPLTQFRFAEAVGVDDHDPARAGHQVLAIAVIKNDLRLVTDTRTDTGFNLVVSVRDFE